MRTVDRSVARMIAYKRIVTGSLAFAAGIGMIVWTNVLGQRPTPLLGVALALFFVGGGWTLRDGLRLRRELLRAPGSS